MFAYCELSQQILVHFHCKYGAVWLYAVNACVTGQFNMYYKTFLFLMPLNLTILFVNLLLVSFIFMIL